MPCHNREPFRVELPIAEADDLRPASKVFIEEHHLLLILNASGQQVDETDIPKVKDLRLFAAEFVLLC